MIDAYVSGNVPLAASITFVINLLIGTVVTITAPSLIIPFYGIAFMLYRVLGWGITFSDPDLGTFIPHALTLIIEGQAYAIAALATWILARMFLQPRQFGMASRWASYKAGLTATLRLYPLIVILLVIGAFYEALEVIYLMPLFR